MHHSPMSNTEATHQFKDVLSPPPYALYGTMSLLVIVLFFVSLATGPTSIGVWSSLVQIGQTSPDLAVLVLQEIRLPRAILGLMVGATLGLAGAALQGLLRNPLAEPGIIGISGSAALGAVIAFYSGASLIYPLLLPVGGIVGALISVFLLYSLAGRDCSILTLVLAGIALNALAGALTALALNLSPNPYASIEIFYWLMGSLSDRSMEHVSLVLLPMLVGWGLLIASGRGLVVLSLGEDTARSLGINLTHLHRLIVFGVALSVGAAVSVTGGIGFVGLVVPHLLRPLVGHHPGRLLVASALGGAALLLAADIVVRWFSQTQELKLGVLTALIGAPFFLALVLKTRREFS